MEVRMQCLESTSIFTLSNFSLHYSLFQISQVGFHLLDEKSDTKVAL